MRGVLLIATCLAFLLICPIVTAGVAPCAPVAVCAPAGELPPAPTCTAGVTLTVPVVALVARRTPVKSAIDNVQERRSERKAEREVKVEKSVRVERSVTTRERSRTRGIKAARDAVPACGPAGCGAPM